MTRARGGRRGRGRGRGASRGRTRAAVAEDTEEDSLEQQSTDTDNPEEEDKQHESEALSQLEDIPSESTVEPWSSESQEEAGPSRSSRRKRGQLSESETTEDSESPAKRGRRSLRGKVSQKSDVMTSEELESSVPEQEETISPTRRGRRGKAVNPPEENLQEQPNEEEPKSADPMAVEDDSKGEVEESTSKDVPETDKPKTEEEQLLSQNLGQSTEVTQTADPEATNLEPTAEKEESTETEEPALESKPEVSEDSEAPTRRGRRRGKMYKVEEAEPSTQEQEETISPSRRGGRGKAGKEKQSNVEEPKPPEATITASEDGEEKDANTDFPEASMDHQEEQQPQNLGAANAQEAGIDAKLKSSDTAEKEEPLESEKSQPESEPEPSKGTVGKDEPMEVEDAEKTVVEKDTPLLPDKEAEAPCPQEDVPEKSSAPEKTAVEKDTPLQPDKETEALCLQEHVPEKSAAQPATSETQEEQDTTPSGDHIEEMESESTTTESEATVISPRRGRPSQRGRGRGRGGRGRGRGKGRGRAAISPEPGEQDTPKKTNDEDDESEDTSGLEAAIATFIEQSSDDDVDVPKSALGVEEAEATSKMDPAVSEASKEDQKVPEKKEDKKSEEPEKKMDKKSEEPEKKEDKKSEEPEKKEDKKFEKQEKKEDKKSEEQKVQNAESRPQETVTAAAPTRRRGRSAGIKEETKPESSEVKTADKIETEPSQHTFLPSWATAKKRNEDLKKKEREESEMPKSKRIKLEAAPSATTTGEGQDDKKKPTNVQEVKDSKEEPQQSEVPAEDSKIKLHLKTKVEKVAKEEEKPEPVEVQPKEPVEEQASPKALLEGLEELDQALDTDESPTTEGKVESPEAELWEQVDGKKPTEKDEQAQEKKTDVPEQQKPEQKTDIPEQQKEIEESAQEQPATKAKKKRKKKEPKPDPMEPEVWVATRTHDRSAKTAAAEAQAAAQDSSTTSTDAEVKEKPASEERYDRLKQTVEWKADQWIWCEVCQMKTRAWLTKTHYNNVKHIELSIFGELLVECPLCKVKVRRPNAVEHYQGTKHSDNAAEKGISWLPLFCEPCGALHLSEKEQEEHKTSPTHVKLLQRMGVANQQTEGLLCCSLCEKGDIGSMEDLRAHYQSGVHLVKLKRSVMGDLAAEANVLDGVTLSWQWEMELDKWYSFTKEETVIINAAVKKEKDVVYLTSKSAGELCLCLDLANMIITDLHTKSKLFLRLRCAVKSDLNNKDYTWQWQHGLMGVFTCWMPYMALHTILLEKASRNHEPTVQITTGPHSYDLDMSSLEHRGGQKGTKKAQRVRAKTEGENSLLSHFGPPPEKQEEKSQRKQQVSAGGSSASTGTASGGSAKKDGGKVKPISFKVKSTSEGKTAVLTKKESRSRSRSRSRDKGRGRRHSRSRSRSRSQGRRRHRDRDRGRSRSRSRSRGRSRSRSRGRDGRRHRRSRRSYSSSSSRSSSGDRRRRSRSRSGRYRVDRSPLRKAKSNHEMMMDRAYQDTMMNARYLAQEKQKLQEEKAILEQNRKLEEERLKLEWAALQDSKLRQQPGLAYPAAAGNKFGYNPIPAANTGQHYPITVPPPPPGSTFPPPPGSLVPLPPGSTFPPPPGSTGFPQAGAAASFSAQGQYRWSAGKPSTQTAQGQYPWSTGKQSTQTAQAQYPWSTGKQSTQTAQAQYPWSTGKSSTQTGNAPSHSQHPWSTGKSSTATSYSQPPWSTGTSSSGTGNAQYPWSSGQASSGTSSITPATHPWSTGNSASVKPTGPYPWSKPDSSQTQSKWDKPPDSSSLQPADSKAPLLPTPKITLLPTPPAPSKPVVQQVVGVKQDVPLMQAVQQTVQAVPEPKKPKPSTLTTWDLISRYLQEQMGIDEVTREAVEQILKQPALVERIQKFYREHGLEPRETQDSPPTVQPAQHTAALQPASTLGAQQASVTQQAQTAGLQQDGSGSSQQSQADQAKVQLLAQLISMGVVQPTDLAASQPELAAASIVQAAKTAIEAKSSASASTEQSLGGWVQGTSQTQAKEPSEAEVRTEWGRNVSEESDRYGRLSEDTPDSYDVRSRGLAGEMPRGHGVGLDDVPGSRGLLRDPPRRAHPDALRDAPPRDPYRRGEDYPDRRHHGERRDLDRYERERLAYERERRERELYDYERRRRELDEWDRRRPGPRDYDESYRDREPMYPGREERERELDEWARSRHQFGPQGSGDPGRGYSERGSAYDDPRPSHDRPGYYPQQDSQELYDPEATTSDGEEDVYDTEEEASVELAKSLLSTVNVPPLAPDLVEDVLRSPEVLDQLGQFRQKGAPPPVVASYLQVVLTQVAASPSVQQNQPRVRTRGKRGGKLSKLRYFQKCIDKIMRELEEIQQMKQRLGDRCPQELHDIIANKSLVLNDFKRKALELEQICKEQGKMV
ncbi:PREDICTED: uncharacterized protein LOC109473756 [Branchiostoma belcheri]|uniref:Uncharacterized protein LOC109473756 n=1 Tax=Branchiostoma belcheri TaxID=7741 RepID=A0A6P4YIU7_BRABE|nr:PREDICTED: uncharacterized protein LOC109473756 [Branchiostoma belcheri]